MKMQGPGVSAIVAVKDGEPYLAEALESIVSQSAPPLEIIVVDGGSRDRSVEVARSFDGVSCIPQEGDGLAGAWNEGVAAAAGELIAFLDSDDRWLPGKLEHQVRVLEERGGLAGVDGLARFVVPEGTEPPPGMRPEWREGEHPAHMPGALLVRREVFDEVGVFDPTYEVALDIDWWARVKDAGLEIATLPRLVVEKRFHGGNLSHSRPEQYARELVRLFKDSTARQRASR